MSNLDNKITVSESSHFNLAWVKNTLTFGALAVLLGVVLGVAIVEINQPVYILLGLVFICVFAGSTIYTEFGLLVLVFLIYTRVSDILVHNYNIPSVAQLYIALLFGAILGRWVLYQEVPRGWLKPFVLIGVYGLMCFVSLLFASDITRVYDSLVVLIKDAIIMILVTVLLQKGISFQRVVWSLIGVGIFLGTISCIQFFTKTFTSSYGGFASANVMEITGATNDYRIGGPVGDPNYFAQIMVVIVPLALERFFHSHRKMHRFFALWALAVCVLSVVFTYSRGGFVALAVVAAVFFLAYPPRFFQVPLLIIAFLVMSLFLPPRYFDRIFSLNQLFQQSGTIRPTDIALRDRETQNLVAFEMFKSNPLFGVGLSNYRTDYDKYASRIGLAIGSSGASAHNLYLEVAAETGFLGLSAFMTLIVTAVVITWKARKKLLQANLSDYAGMVSAFGIGLFGYLVGAFFIHGAYPRYFYLLMGIGFSLEAVVMEMLLWNKSKKTKALHEKNIV